MIIDPHKTKKHIKMIDENNQVQPAGIDLTVNKILIFKNAGVIDFDNTKRKIAETEEIELSERLILLKKGSYKVIFNEIIKIPPNVVGLAWPRSTLLRNGASIFTSVWDPGYEGRSESLLVVFNDNGLYITKNAKIAQLLFIKMEKKAKKLYSGIYKNENI
jgi:dUTP pyrophosphatase